MASLSLLAVSTFNAASHFDTHPSLLARAYNRPRMSTLRSQAIHGALDNMEVSHPTAITGSVLLQATRLSTRKTSQQIRSHLYHIIQNNYLCGI